MRRAAIIVLDGIGVGPTHDTDRYGDTGSDSLGNVARQAGGLQLPNLERLGLGLMSGRDVPAQQHGEGRQRSRDV